MKILIIDSDKKLAKAINREIDVDLYEVCFAADGIIRQKVAQEKKFDIVVVGCVLADENSLSILNDFRAQNTIVPIMVAIENYTLENITLLISSGASACVAKTSASKVIIARMNALMRRTEWGRSAEVIYDRIRLAPVTPQSLELQEGNPADIQGVQSPFLLYKKYRTGCDEADYSRECLGLCHQRLHKYN